MAELKAAEVDVGALKLESVPVDMLDQRKSRSIKTLFKKTGSSVTSTSASSLPMSSTSSTDNDGMYSFRYSTAIPPSAHMEVQTPSSDQLYDRLANLRNRVNNAAVTIDTDYNARLSRMRSGSRTSPSKATSQSPRSIAQGLAALPDPAELERRASRSSVSSIMATTEDDDIRGERYDVKWVKGPLGVSLRLHEEYYRPFVSKLTAGQAEELGIRVGDILLTINRVSTGFVSFENAAKILATIRLPGVLTFVRPTENCTIKSSLSRRISEESETTSAQVTPSPSGEQEVAAQQVTPATTSIPDPETHSPYFTMCWTDKSQKLGLVFTPNQYGTPMVKKIIDGHPHYGKELLKTGDNLLAINNVSAKALGFEACMEMIKHASQQDDQTLLIFHSVSMLAL